MYRAPNKRHTAHLRGLPFLSLCYGRKDRCRGGEARYLQASHIAAIHRVNPRSKGMARRDRTPTDGNYRIVSESPNYHDTGGACSSFSASAPTSTCFSRGTICSLLRGSSNTHPFMLAPQQMAPSQPSLEARGSDRPVTVINTRGPGN